MVESMTSSSCWCRRMSLLDVMNIYIVYILTQSKYDWQPENNEFGIASELWIGPNMKHIHFGKWNIHGDVMSDYICNKTCENARKWRSPRDVINPFVPILRPLNLRWEARFTRTYARCTLTHVHVLPTLDTINNIIIEAPENFLFLFFSHIYGHCDCEPIIIFN